MDLSIIGKADFKLLIEKFLFDKLDGSINIEFIEETNLKEKTTLLSDSSILKIKVHNNFIDLFLNDTDNYKLFIIELTTIFEMISKSSDEALKYSKSFSGISIIYQLNDLAIHFTFNFLSEKYLIAFKNALKIIAILRSGKSKKFIKNIENTFDEGNGKRYFSYNYDDEKWNLVDPLTIISNSLNEKYRQDRDVRIKKPHIAINEENIWKYFVFDSNWVLVFDNLETLMTKPNDVSIYSSIAEKNLTTAESFYSKNILPRHKYYSGGFPSVEMQKEYFDYFEYIIQSIIFAYTSLEAFANIFIPENYEHIMEKDGIKTIYSKEAIEKKFSLRDKFKLFLKQILDTPDVTKEQWWNDFIKLEDIRNEIIHSKPSKSEERYSKFLSKSIFQIVKIHREIISYYGNYIYEKKKSMLDEFPYDFGHDEVSPGIMKAKDYEDSHRSLNNIKF